MLGFVTATVGIAVVHYRTPEVALDCLARLEAAVPGAQVVVVDTAPEPAFQERLAAAQPAARFIAAPNHSYSRSVNLGVAALTTHYIALMNADVLVNPDTFDRLLAALAMHDGLAVAAPLALAPGGAPQRMGLPYALHYWRLRRAAARTAAATGGQDSEAQVSAAVEVPWLAAYLQCMPRAVWERLGGYDESFRFFNEDMDFCFRVREHGYRCLLVDAPVVHLGGSSTPAHPAFHVEGRRGGMLLTLRHRGAAYRAAHAAYLWLEAWLGSRLARSASGRQAHRAMLRLLRSGRWHDSPFGATLDDRG